MDEKEKEIIDYLLEKVSDKGALEMRLLGAIHDISLLVESDANKAKVAEIRRMVNNYIKIWG